MSAIKLLHVDVEVHLAEARRAPNGLELPVAPSRPLETWFEATVSTTLDATVDEAAD